MSGKEPPSYVYSSSEDAASQEKFVKDGIAEGCLIQSLVLGSFQAVSSKSETDEAEMKVGALREGQDGRAGRSLGETSPRHTWPPPLLFFQDARGIK